jgi:uncharacterized protein YjbJ (UPF0337 family)
MNKDTIVGKAKQVEGKIRDAKGDFTDDPTDDLKGKAKVAEGKLQEGLGKVKQAVDRSKD